MIAPVRTLSSFKGRLNGLFFLILTFGAVSAWGQTNPAAQTLPYSQSFVSSSFSILPAGWAAWNGMDGSAVTTQALAEATAPSGNAPFAARVSISPVGGVFGYADGVNGNDGVMYIQTSSNETNGVNQVALAINTTGQSGIRVAYDVEIISAQPRTVGIVMQYRVGTSGSWTTVSTTGNPYSQAGGTAGVKANVSATLPAAADNKPVVQLRWATWRGTETGTSSGIGIDNIAICPTPVFSLGTPSVCLGATSAALSYTATSGFSAPNQYSIDFDATANAAGFEDVPLTTLPASPINIPVPGTATATVYNATLTIQNACGVSATKDFTVSVNALPVCSATGADYVCDNSTGNIYTAPAGMASYNWSISGSGSIPGSTTGQTVSVTSGNYLNNYTVAVTITDANGCVSNCTKYTDIFLFTPPANITVNPNPACFGASIDLSIAAAASSTVSWTGEGVSNSSGTFVPDDFFGYYNQTTAVPTSPGSKVYSVSVVADNGCSNTGSVNVTVNPLPSAPSCPPNSSVCVSTPAYALTGGSPGGGTYSGPGVSAGNFNPATAGVGMHTITYTVTDGNSCTNTCSFTVSVNPPPTCSITFTNPPPWGQDTTCANSTGNVYSAPGGMSAYNWSIAGSGTITGATNGSSVTVTAGNSGNYYLSVTITDANGCISTCSDETPIKLAPTCLLSGPASVACNSTGNVFSVSNSSFFISSYNWSVSGDATITSPTNGSSVTVTAGTSNFTINVTSTDFNACTSFCSQNVTVPGCNLDFSGKIIFSNNNALGVNNATVNLAGSGTGSDVSDTNGDFSISSGLNSGTFTLTPTKTVSKLNGLTAADVSAIQQHVANTTPITDPYKLVAADVNKTNSINSLDASIINQALLGNPSALAQIKTSWRFVPTSHTMTNPPWGFPEKRTYTNINSSQSNQDFYGIKTGDVVSSFANPANLGAGQPLVLQSTDRVLQAGENIAVTFNAGQMDDLAAFQCALRFDPEQLQVVEIQPSTAIPLAMDNFGTYNIGEGEIRMVWAQASGVAFADGAPVFSLQFTTLQSGAKLSEVLQLDESELPAVSYTTALTESKVALTFSELSGTANPAGAAGVQLLQNRPNPFNGQTSIGFVLPEACEAQLRVFDVSGRLLTERKGQYAEGKNEELFEVKGAAGVLYYELTTPFGVVAKKMLATRN